VKIGVSASASEVGEALRLFDYVETWDVPEQGQAYHTRCDETKLQGNFLYVVKHIDCPDLNFSGTGVVLYENIYSITYEEFVKKLGSRMFLLDVGHAFISDMKSKGAFEIEKWLGLNPVAVHIHNVKYVPDPTGRYANAPYADHQPLNEGLLNIRDVLSKIIKAGVEYITIEVFFKDYMPTKYALTQIKQWVDNIIKYIDNNA
jgi:hypothetical protein